MHNLVPQIPLHFASTICNVLREFQHRHRIKSGDDDDDDEEED